MTMKEIKFRKLRADEIQVRPTDTKHKGSCLLLLYQDARCAMNILDETVGQYGWQKDFKEINGNIYCGIGILNQPEEFKPLGYSQDWIWKWDCGAFTAKEEDMQSKADASDATKRAAVCWGIGRELYATPKLKINCPDSYYYNDKMNMTFTVKSIEWDGDKLVDLVVVDRFGKTVYDYNGNEPTEEQKFFQLSNEELLVEFCKKEKPNLDETMKQQLENFYRYYSPKVKNNGWKGSFEPSQLWKNWCGRIKNVE